MNTQQVDLLMRTRYQLNKLAEEVKTEAEVLSKTLERVVASLDEAIEEHHRLMRSKIRS